MTSHNLSWLGMPCSKHAEAPFIHSLALGQSPLAFF